MILNLSELPYTIPCLILFDEVNNVIKCHDLLVIVVD